MSSTPQSIDNTIRTLRFLGGDLLLGSRIAHWGRAAGYSTSSSLSLPHTLPNELAEHARCVIDLKTVKGDWQNLLADLDVANRDHLAVFAPHVRTDLLVPARNLGLIHVWTQSQLDQKLPAWLESAPQ